MNDTKFSAVILAAGSASRMNGINKQLALLDDIPVIVRSALAFERSRMVEEIIVAAPPGEEQYYFSLLQNHLVTKLKTVVSGGASRAASVMNALVECSCGHIAIHDGARPLISTEDIDRVLCDAAEYGAAIAAAPVNDTIKVCSGGNVGSTPDRSTLYAAQTPQAFRRELYISCVTRLGSRADSVTDDSMVLELCGEKVHVTPVTACNLKITRPEDLLIAQAVLRR